VTELDPSQLGTKRSLCEFGQRPGMQGYQMSKAAMYKRYAADCLRFAQSVKASDDRALLVEMAAAWQRLSDHVERMNEERSSK
jgi:hypothetical protein